MAIPILPSAFVTWGPTRSFPNHTRPLRYATCWRVFFVYLKIPVAFALCLSIAYAQDKPDPTVIMNRILQRLDALETENRQLVEEVHSLRQELEKSRSPSTSGENAESNQQSLQDRVTTNE